MLASMKGWSGLRSRLLIYRASNFRAANIIERKNMKSKYAAALVAIILTSISIGALAEKQSSAGKAYLLKAGGQTIAELRIVAPSASWALKRSNSASHADYNMKTSTILATGGVMLEISAGTNSISVHANEIESVPDSN
jgi:hypothetical protein